MLLLEKCLADGEGLRRQPDMVIRIDWARLKSLKDTNSWAMFYKLQGTTGVSVWCGTENHQLACTISGTKKDDFDDNYKSGATTVGCEGDALSRIITF